MYIFAVKPNTMIDVQQARELWLDLKNNSLIKECSENIKKILRDEYTETDLFSLTFNNLQEVKILQQYLERAGYKVHMVRNEKSYTIIRYDVQISISDVW